MPFLDTVADHRHRQVAASAVYSLHKTSTREFILKKCLTWGFKAEVLAEMKASASYECFRLLTML